MDGILTFDDNSKNDTAQPLLPCQIKRKKVEYGLFKVIWYSCSYVLAGVLRAVLAEHDGKVRFLTPDRGAGGERD